MASFMEKVQINSAITDNTKLDLGHQHITTADFMQLQPSMTKEMVPGERLDVAMESFARLNPLPVPTFGRASLRNRAFFVPYRTVFRGWNDFITDAVHVPATVVEGATNNSGIISRVPIVENEALVEAFLGTDYLAPGAVNLDTPGAYETAMNSNYMTFRVVRTDTSVIPPHDINCPGDWATEILPYFDLTIKGRQYFKVLEALGYKIIWQKYKEGGPNYVNPIYSALPLLCLAKVFSDWYWPTQYTNLWMYDKIVSLCNKDNNLSPVNLSNHDVNQILNFTSYVMYDADMFTACFDQPNSPNQGVYSDFKLVNIDSIGQIYGSNNYLIRDQNGVSNRSANSTNSGDAIDRYGQMNAPFITGYVAGGTSGSSTSTVITGGISQYLLHGLHAMTDYLKRHQLAGSKAADRYLARFGKALSAEKLNRSVYLGASMQDVQIGDIMSTADTAGSDGAQLGGYAGKGMSYGNGHFEFSSDEYGLFIILTSIVPAIGYFQGIDKTVKHISKLDFYTPEYDALGVDAVGADELYVPQNYSGGFANLPSQVFGFLPKYYEYKVKNDKVTGNFRLNSINGANPQTPSEFNAANSWYLMRVFDDADFDNVAQNIVHSPNFLMGAADASQFKRIFYNVDPSAPDNFTIIHNFEIASYSPMKSLFDTYEFEDKGKKITTDINGVKMN